MKNGIPVSNEVLLIKELSIWAFMFAVKKTKRLREILILCFMFYTFNDILI